MRKAVFTLIVTGALVSSFVTIGLAMSDHWINGGAANGYVGCQASIDDMNQELQYPRHWVRVDLYAPSGQWLGAGYDGRSDGSFANATFSIAAFGSGTYHCHATYHEEWDGGAQWEDDTMDSYFDY
jgi:hypothetical protein